MALRGYTSATASVAIDTSGRTANRLAVPTAHSIVRALSTPYTEIIVGVAYLCPSAQSSLIFSLRDGANDQIYVRRDAAGAIGVYRGTPAGTLISSTYAVMLTNSWQYVELRALIHASAGSFTLKVDGVTLETATGKNTKGSGLNATISGVQLLYPESSGSNGYDDFYVADPAVSPNNDFLGPVKIYNKVPSGAGSSAGFTPSTGTNHGCVDETPMSEADYVSALAVNLQDLYAIGDLGLGSGTVKEVAVHVGARRTELGARSIALPVKSGGTTDVGGNNALTGTLANYTRAMAVNPVTGLAWLLAEVDALEAGVKVTV